MTPEKDFVSHLDENAKDIQIVTAIGTTESKGNGNVEVSLVNGEAKAILRNVLGVPVEVVSIGQLIH